MKPLRMKKLAALILCALSLAAMADDAEYFALARKASCAELIDAYKSRRRTWMTCATPADHHRCRQGKEVRPARQLK